MKNQVIKSSFVYHSKHSWLESRHIFSFSNYYDPNNMWFWNMRVFNDDYIDAKSWFWMHPHDNMEILTIMIEWEITHSDNIWNTETIKKWYIQTMSAWVWVLHSEKNLSNEKTHLYQIWFLPNNYNSKPIYKDQNINLKNNDLTLLASNNLNDNVWYLNSNVLVYRGLFDFNQKFNYDLRPWKWLFIYMTNWELSINWNILKEKDHLRYVEPWCYDFNITKNSDFILIEVEL
jgi:redox-sensitive bicupin YhaK (pirin superfamily)